MKEHIHDAWFLIVAAVILVLGLYVGFVLGTYSKVVDIEAKIQGTDERQTRIDPAVYWQRKYEEANEALEKCAAARMSECVEVGE